MGAILTIVGMALIFVYRHKLVFLRTFADTEDSKGFVWKAERLLYFGFIESTDDKGVQPYLNSTERHGLQRNGKTY